MTEHAEGTIVSVTQARLLESSFDRGLFHKQSGSETPTLGGRGSAGFSILWETILSRVSDSVEFKQERS
jgi:hypothetical protein